MTNKEAITRLDRLMGEVTTDSIHLKNMWEHFNGEPVVVTEFVTDQRQLSVHYATVYTTGNVHVDSLELKSDDDDAMKKVLRARLLDELTRQRDSLDKAIKELTDGFVA